MEQAKDNVWSRYRAQSTEYLEESVAAVKTGSKISKSTGFKLSLLSLEHLSIPSTAVRNNSVTQTF
jgi:hypothetical protein